MEPLEKMTAFPYLGCTIAFNASYFVALYRNLRKVQWGWGMVAKVLMKTGATVQEQDIMYKAGVKMVLL